MTLTKTEIFKARPGFNHKAAQAMYDIVMKMDEDAARSFCTIVVADVLEETIEKNLRSIQGHLNQVVAKRAARIKKALISKALTDPEGALPFAREFVEIEKAARNPYDYGYVWQESDFRRDPGTGRFRTKVNTTQRRPMPGRQANAMGIPLHDNDPDKGGSMSSADRARFQQEYLQLANFLGSVNSSSRNPGEEDVLLHLKNKNGQRYTVRSNGTRPDTSKWDPSVERLEGIEARPGTLRAGGVTFGLTSALGASEESSRRAAETTNAVDRNFGQFSNDWLRDTDPRSSTAQTYNRLSAGSKFLAEVAPAGSKLQMAAGIGQFVGDHGAEAEKIVGPTARKTAYRYRGMTKEPDAEVVGRFNTSINSAKQRAGDARRNLSPVQQAAERITNERRNPTWEERGAGRAVLAEYLNDQGVRPKAGLYNLQLAAGKTPPSQGFIVDSDGKIAAQAAGYGDDHYLPFNLKNLKGLKGGEYVRSRSVGGPTSEDIYTAVMGGAKGFTVTSRSGTFMVTFNDELGKRTPDKARRMTRRYEQILDAVQSEQVDNERLSDEIRAGIVAEVRAEATAGHTPRQINERIQERIEEFKESPDISANDERLISIIASNRAMARPGRDASEFMDEVTNEIAAEKEYKFRLNGRGYAAALDALQEQFPYYMTVNSVPTRQLERTELSRDKGYVEPGRNRPTEAQAGLYGTKIRYAGGNAGEKFSASRADYQRGRGSGEKRTEGAAAAVPGAPEQKKSEAPQSAEQKIAENRNRAVVEDAAVELHASMLRHAPVAPEGAESWWNLDEAEFSNWLRKDPRNKQQFDQVLDFASSTEMINKPGFRPAVNKYRQAQGGFGNSAEYDSLLGTRFPETPYKFGGDAYEGNAVAAQRELTRVGSAEGLVHNKTLSQMSDDELRDEVNVVRHMLQESEGLDLKDLGFAGITALVGENVRRDSPTLRVLQSGDEGLRTHLENIHRTRALRGKTQAPEQPGDIVVNNGTLKTIDVKGPQMEHLSTQLRKAEDMDDEVAARLARTLQDDLENSDVLNQDDLAAWRKRNDEHLQRLFQATRAQ